MKKILVCVILVIALFAVTIPSYAITTLYLGDCVGGNGSSNDYHDMNTFQNNPGDINSRVIEFTNISENKKIKIDVDYETGDFKYILGPPSFGMLDLKVGFPCIIKDKGLVYFTVGLLNYNEFSQNYPKHELNGNMLGFDIIATPSDRFQLEVNLQRSILGGSAKLYYDPLNPNTTKDSSSELTVFKLKLQYIFTDNLGLAIQYRVMECNVTDFMADAVDVNSTALGFVYRF
jgi:hypothetical protein